MVMWKIRQIEVGDIVRVKGLGPSTIGMVQQICKYSDLSFSPEYINMLNSKWNLWGFDKSSWYKVDLGGPMKVLTEEEFDMAFGGKGYKYNQLQRVEMAYYPAKCVSLHNSAR